MRVSWPDIVHWTNRRRDVIRQAAFLVLHSAHLAGYQLIQREVQQGADMVINLAAGLDSRPYRMQLPASLRWIEIDLPAMLSYKQEVLAAERPLCTLERVPLDLKDTLGRRALFLQLGGEAKRVVVVSEGLIIYFESDGAAELARDLAAGFSFRCWVTDLTSPALLKMLQKTIGGPLVDAGSPLIRASGRARILCSIRVEVCSRRFHCYIPRRS